MSGETKQDVSGWTVDTLHEFVVSSQDDLRRHLDERYETQRREVDRAFAAAEKAVQAALAAAEKAVAKAEVATEKRIEGLNELRVVVQDISKLQMPRTEAENRLAAITANVDELKEAVARIVSLKQGGREQINSVYAFAGFLATCLILGTILAANGVFGK